MGNTRKSMETSGRKILYPSSKRKNRRNTAIKFAKLKKVNCLSDKEAVGDVMSMDTSNFMIENSFRKEAAGDIILKEKQEAQAVHINVQEEETSGPSSFNIKQEITIDESDLDHLNFPKLEPVQNTSEVIDRVEGNCNINISPSTSNKFHEERKTNDKDNRIEDGDLLNTVQGEVENGDKYVEYGMYIANRLRNANQSDSAIDIAKQEIEVILNELERGIFTISLH